MLWGTVALSALLVAAPFRRSSRRAALAQTASRLGIAVAVVLALIVLTGDVHHERGGAPVTTRVRRTFGALVVVAVVAMGALSRVPGRRAGGGGGISIAGSALLLAGSALLALRIRVIVDRHVDSGK